MVCYSSSDAAPSLLRFFDLRSASRSVTRTPYFDSVCERFVSGAVEVRGPVGRTYTRELRGWLEPWKFAGRVYLEGPAVELCKHGFVWAVGHVGIDVERSVAQYENTFPSHGEIL